MGVLFALIYGDDTSKAVALFKKQFNVDNIHINNDKNSFQKLMNDYGLTTSTDIANWTDKIIDKEILVGDRFSGSDIVINSTTGGDTGLYELYNNVVTPFIKAMMTKAVLYTTSAVTKEWRARTGEGAVATTKYHAHGLGMSYCYDCKDTIPYYNKVVINCRANSTLAKYEGDAAFKKDKNGNTVTDQYGYPICNIGTVASGTGRWAGLYESEYKLAATEPQFKTRYWAGIDCSGLVTRSIGYAHSLQKSLDLQGSYGHPMDSVYFINSTKIFDPQLVFFEKAAPFKDTNAVIHQHEQLMRGDLVSYSGHVSIVYSPSSSNGRFQIIHAFGNDFYWRKVNHINKKVFSRKTIVTEDNVSHALRRPKGYGRIRLWN